MSKTTQGQEPEIVGSNKQWFDFGIPVEWRRPANYEEFVEAVERRHKVRVQWLKGGIVKGDRSRYSYEEFVKVLEKWSDKRLSVCKEDVNEWLKVVNDKNATDKQYIAGLDAMSRWAWNGLEVTGMTAKVGLAIIENSSELSASVKEKLLVDYTNSEVFLATVEKFGVSKEEFSQALQSYALMGVWGPKNPMNHRVGEALVREAEKLGLPNSELIRLVPQCEGWQERKLIEEALGLGEAKSLEREQVFGDSLGDISGVDVIALKRERGAIGAGMDELTRRGPAIT